MLGALLRAAAMGKWCCKAGPAGLGCKVAMSHTESSQLLTCTGSMLGTVEAFVFWTVQLHSCHEVSIKHTTARQLEHSLTPRLMCILRVYVCFSQAALLSSASAADRSLTECAGCYYSFWLGILLWHAQHLAYVLVVP